VNRLPILPTLIVVAAVAVMIALGIWQLQRAAWKERMLAELAAAQSLPAVDLDPLIARGTAESAAIAFRRALVTCEAGGARPALRAGRNRRGETGYSYFVPCRPGASGLAGRIEVNAGWAREPRADLAVDISGAVAGIIGTAEPDGPVLLTAAAADPPLEPSAPPRVEDIANNHLAYAFQWFFFAGAAAIIYLLALRRRRR
jgi:surfeit locus 1 family protein